MTVGRSGQRPYNPFFWPWSPRSAVVVVPLALISLLVALGVTRSVMSWPDPRHALGGFGAGRVEPCPALSSGA